MIGDEAVHAPVPEDVTVSLLEERLVIGKAKVTTGKVRVATRTDTVEEMAHAILHGEAVDVTRVPIDLPVTGPVPQIRTEGDVTIVPVLEEIMVVEKRLVLKEELHIRRRATEQTVDIPVTLRRQTATVERLDVPPPEHIVTQD